LVQAARAGYLGPVWSPLIIAESNRVLTWIWLKRRGGDFSERSWRECSDAAKGMFQHLTAVFRVVDDYPSGDTASWTDEPPDKWDIPIWTAAVRSQAGFIVTENLSDAPPPDADGNRAFRDVLFVHPDEFVRLLHVISEIVEAQNLAVLPDDVLTTPEQAEVASTWEEQLTPSVPEAYHPLLLKLMREGKL
jgi:hypothetical protein